MEELLAVLVGTGAVVFSPFLIPGLRPVAKSAIKGGMAVADAAKGAAVATTEGCSRCGEQGQRSTQIGTEGGRACEAPVEEAASAEPAAPNRRHPRKA